MLDTLSASCTRDILSLRLDSRLSIHRRSQIHRHFSIREAGMTIATMHTPTQSVDSRSLGCCGVVLAAPLPQADAIQLARGFAALADPVRLRLLSIIASSGECCSCDLEEPLGKAQPTISHHTKALAEAGLITGEKRGRWVWWRVVPGECRRPANGARRQGLTSL